MNTPSDAAHRLVLDAASDAEAVAWATGLVEKLISGWAEASESRRRELWTDAAEANEALRDRFRDRIETLPGEPADGTALCDSHAHPDFTGGHVVPCQLPAGHFWHRNGTRQWTP